MEETIEDELVSGKIFTKWGSLCDLLEHAELIDNEQSNGVFLTAAQNEITPGEFLYVSRAMPPELVRAAILCQLMIRDQLMTLNVARKTLMYCAARNLSLEEALDSVGWNRKYFEHLKLSCCLLEDAGILTQNERTALVEIALKQNLPLVKVIQERKVTSRLVADACLNLESMVYADSITYDLAVRLLLLCHQEQIDLASAFERADLHAISKSLRGRLGELVVSGGFVAVEDLLLCIEISLVYRRMLGEILVEQGILSQEELDEVLDLQRKIRSGSLSVKIAVEHLKKLSSKKNGNSSSLDEEAEW